MAQRNLEGFLEEAGDEWVLKERAKGRVRATRGLGEAAGQMGRQRGQL